MPYPLTETALRQMEDSYAEFGGVPRQARDLVGGAIMSIDTFVDRPEAEKDALMAATALFFSTDMTVYKELPENIEIYGRHVQRILEDAAANPSKPFAASPDLMQIGLALSIPTKDVAVAMIQETRGKLEGVAEDPALLRAAIAQMKKAIDKGHADGALYFTGEQPRLEAKAKEVVDAVKAATDDLVAYMDSLLNPPGGGGKPKPAAPVP